MDKNQFGNYIKEKRQERELTQKELANLLFIDVTAVSKWERGMNYPDITMIPSLCKALGVNEHELIESSNDTEARIQKADAKKFRRLKNSLFYSLSGGYGVAVLVCFLVNLAVEGGLSWFFPVLAGCLCGFTFFPSMMRFVPRYKLAAYTVSTFIGLFLLFLTCSIYTGNFWVWVATVGCLLGYFALFFPIFFAHRVKFKKAFMLTYVLGLLALTLLLLLATYAYENFPLLIAVKITLYVFALPLAYSLNQLLPFGGFLKAGLDCLLAIPFCFGLNKVLHLCVEGNDAECFAVNFRDWATCSDGNVLILISGVLLLLTLLFFALAASKNRARE